MSNRVLIVDDEENIRQMIRLTLNAAGYEVGEAQDGIEAFAILGGDPDWNVVMLDQRMPLMEGTDVLRRIKVLAPDARIVMMTAFASIDLAVEAMRLGATDFLRKPMTPEIVRNSVSAALKRGRGHDYKSVPAGVHPHRSVTLNGFTILRRSDSVTVIQGKRPEYRFIVRKPDGSEEPVTVQISESALAEARGLLRSEPDESFWVSQAETFLRDFIWNDGNVPAGGKLILKGVDRDLVTAIPEQAEEK